MHLKRKQKNVNGGKQLQDQIKQIKNYLGDGKNLIQKASSRQDYQEALQILNKAIMKSSSIQVSNSYLLYYYRGLCYLNLKQLEKAERDFIQGASLTDDKGRIQIYNSLGRCKVQMADEDPTYLQQAKKCYQKALQYSNNTDGEAFLKLAQIYRKIKGNENIQQAIKCYSDSLTFLKPHQQYEAYSERGLCYRQKNMIKESINDFIKASQLKEDQPSAYFNLGMNYLLSQQYKTAGQKFDIAIRLKQNEPHYQNFKGLALYLNKQYDTCIAVYRQTIKLFEDKDIKDDEVGECWFNQGNSLLYLNRQEQAIKAFNKALQCNIKPNQRLKIYYSQGLAFQLRKNIIAIQKFNDSLCLIGDNKNHQLYLSTLYHLALNQYTHQKYAQAIKHMSKITQEGCHQRCVYELRGKIYLDDKKFQLALKDFEILLSLEPNYPDVYYYLGMCKANLGQIDAAIVDFFKAVDLGSKNINIMNGISYAYLKSGRPDKALVYINIALQKQPKNQQFLIQRSMIYLQLNENRKAILDLNAALGQNNKNPSTFYRRGLSYYKSKLFQQAIKDLEKSLEHQPSQQIQHDIYYLIGVSYANKEDYASAIQPFSRAIALQKLPKYYHQRAKCYILLQNYKQALQDLNQVIDKQPQNAFAYFRRGLTYKSLKMYEQSAQNFMKARELAPDDPKLILNKKQIYEIKFRKLCEPGEQQ